MEQQTAETIMVCLINKDAIIKMLNDVIPAEDGTEYYIDEQGLVLDTNVIVDNECVYHIMEKYVHSGKVQPVYDFAIRTKTKTATGYSMGMLPKFYFPVPLEVLETICDPAVSLREFMGSRFDYNPRIKKNTRNFIQDVGSQIA